LKRPRRLGSLVLFLAGVAAGCATRQPSPPQAAVPPPPVAPAPAPVQSPLAEQPEEGMASWYGGDDGFEGKPTASGETFDSSQLTAAHRELPFGTLVDVTNVENGRTVRVRINDRGPFAKGRILDLSQEAARRLGLIGPGTGTVRLTVVTVGPSPTPAASRAQWVVQVGSFADSQHAARQVDRLRAAGRDATLEPYRGLTRVQVGPYATREEAASVLAELEGAGFEGIVLPK
jgi:rare lipoprotein A